MVATCKRTAHPKPGDGQPQAPSTDSDELLIAVFEHVRDETTQAVLDAFANAPDDPRAKAHAAISAAWQLIFDDPRKGRVLFIEAARNTTLREQRQQTWINSAQILSAIIRDYLGENNAEPATSNSPPSHS